MGFFTTDDSRMIDQRRMPALLFLFCVVLATTPLTGAHARDRTDDMAQNAAMNAPAGAASPADKAMMSGMKSMQQAMDRAPMNGDPDHDFVSMMTPHHQGAIDMAQVELRYGHDPELRRLARDVIAAQEREIGEMDRWTAAHPAPTP